MNIDIAGFTNIEVLELIYAGLEASKRDITTKIAEIRTQLGSTDRKTPKIALETPETPKPAKKRYLSPAARLSIALAQKKRWKEHHRLQAQAKNAQKPAKRAKSAKPPARKRIPPAAAAIESNAVQ